MWRGLTLLVCFLVGIVLASAAYYRHPPTNHGYRGIQERRQSDFKPVQNDDQRLGLFEFIGSAAVLWFGCVVWWSRENKVYDQYSTFFMLPLILSIVLGIFMTLIAGTAVAGAV